MQRIPSALLIISLFALPPLAAQAQSERWPRWYLGLAASLTYLNDSDISGATTGEMEFDTGAGFAASLGYMPPFEMAPFNNMRLEAELAYRRNDLDQRVTGGVASTARGAMRVWSYMANAYYDFRNQTRWTPYFGAGAGGAEVKLGSQSGLGNTDETDNVFAYQFMAGLTYSPQSMPQTDWGLGYRYFATGDVEYATAASRVELEYDSHNIELGARFRF